MKRIVYFTLALILFFLLGFGIVHWLKIGVLLDASYLSQMPPWLSLTVSLLLLISDIFIPIPSSIVMIINGILFGFWGGGTVSLAGGFIGTMIGFFLGKRGNKRLLESISEQEKIRIHNNLHQWGGVGIACTRPIPLLSESFAIMAGTIGFTTRKMIVFTIAGWLPISFIYAYVGQKLTPINGTIQLTEKNINISNSIFLATICLTIIIWLMLKIKLKLKISSKG